MRVAIFTDRNSVTTAALVRRVTEVVADRTDLEIAAIVTGPHTFQPVGRRRRTTRVLESSVRVLANPSEGWRRRLHPRIERSRDQTWRGVPFVSPPSGDINAATFVDRLTVDLGVDVALSMYCRRIFKERLLDRLDQAVNFHDGLLPAYRGVGATSFSIYEGAPRSGFTFHRMVRQVDAGPVLCAGSVAIDEQSRLDDVMEKKTRAAVAVLPKVVDAIVGRDPGDAQQGEARVYTKRGVDEITRVEVPERITEDDLRRRLRAFGVVHVTIGGRPRPVTRVRGARRSGGLSFSTADGSLLEPDRLDGYPAFLERRRMRTRAARGIMGASHGTARE